MTVVEANQEVPFKETAISRYLTKQIDALSGVKSQRTIALELGYKKPNIISMFKSGTAPIPLDKIPPLARSLHVDAAHLFRLALQQYWPSLKDTVEKTLGNIATANEEELFLKRWRAATKDMDPASNPKVAAAFKRFLAEVLDAKGEVKK